MHRGAWVEKTDAGYQVRVWWGDYAPTSVHGPYRWLWVARLVAWFQG